MKKLLGFMCAAALIFGTLGIADATPYNVAQGASVSLSGSFFTEFQDWSTANPDGSPESKALIDSIVDGIFLPEGTQWDQGTLWWDEHGQNQNASVIIDLGQDYCISSFIVQADNNDSYKISYLDNTGWAEIGTLVPGWGMLTRPEIYLPSTITASKLAITALSGDDWYSLSEIQAFGEPVPEPATLFLLGFGLIGLAGIRRKYIK